MFKKKINKIAPPPRAKKDGSQEIARIWVSPDGNQQFVLLPTWEDPAAWGLMLVDLAKHISAAYQNSSGVDSREVLQRIKVGFEAEWEPATDTPIDLS